MRKTLVCGLILLMFGWITGCDSDSNDDGPSDAERFVNTWTLSQVMDDRGDQTAVFLEGFNGITVAFTPNGTYTMVVDAKDDTQDVTLTGPYVANESAKTVSLTIEFGGQTLQFPLSYSFQNDTTLLLSGNSVLLNPLLQTGLQGNVTLTFSAS